MIRLLCFFLAVLGLPFKSKLRLEAENEVLRHQLIVMRRKLRGRVQLACYRWDPFLNLALRDRHVEPDQVHLWLIARNLSGETHEQICDPAFDTGHIRDGTPSSLSIMTLGDGLRAAF